jgi:hypothetical protein
MWYSADAAQVVGTDVQMEMVVMQLVGRGRQHHREISAGPGGDGMQEPAARTAVGPVFFDIDLAAIGQLQPYRNRPRGYAPKLPVFPGF